MQALVVSEDLGSSGPAFTVWPKEIFEVDFELIEQVGQGHFGKVYCVKRRKTGNEDVTYAAKFITCKGATARLKIRDEMDLLGHLNHHNILRLVTAYEDPEEELVIQITEFLSGGELFERILDSNEKLVECEIRDYIRQICCGCAYLATNNIAHLDLKPENIMCSSKDNTKIKIVDFGFAKRLTEGSETRVMQGTPEFASPEVINYDPISTTTDMWSVGVITYVLLSGLSPFLGADNQDTYNNITSLCYVFEDEEFENTSSEAKDFIRSLLVINQEDRMSAAKALYHPWMLTELSRKELYSRKERLQKMVARMRWQKCTNMAKAVSRFKRVSE